MKIQIEYEQTITELIIDESPSITVIIDQTPNATIII